MTRTVVIQSCVGGGPMERLAARLTDIDRRSTVDALYSGEEWRELMASGSLGRLRARLGAFIRFPLATLSATMRNRRAVVVPTTNPFFLPGFVVATRPLHRRPVVPLVYDLWPDAAEVSGALDSGSWPTRFAARFNRWWLHRSDGVVFIGPNMASRIGERYGYPQRSAIIETGADLTEFLDAYGEVGTSSLDRWLKEGFVVSYVGNMGVMHDVDTLAQAVGLLEPDAAAHGVRVLIAASGPGPDRLRAHWGDFDEKLIRFEEPLPDDMWRRALIGSDVALVTLRDEAADTSLPSKTFSAMAAGCAIVAVAPAGSDLAQCVESSGAGTVIAPGDAWGLAETLMAYNTDPELLCSHQAAASTAARERYDMPALARRWDDFLGAFDR